MRSQQTFPSPLVIGFYLSPVALFLVSVFGVWLTKTGEAGMAPWLEAVSTAGTLLAAMAAAAFAWRAFDLERQRDLERDQERRREQASLVGAWVVLKGGTCDLYVRNASPLPVSAVFIDIAVMDSDIGMVVEPIIPPSASEVLVPLNPTMKRDIVFAMKAQSVGGLGISVRIRLTDAAGVTWVRDWDGSITAA